MKKLLTTLSIVSASLLFATPAFASTATISGNGAGSYNKVKVVSKTSATTVQSNTAKFKNNIGAGSSTGNVSANKNTGGDVTVTTGNASTTVDVTNTANVNVSDGSTNACCPCGETTSDVSITGNGAGSYNKVITKTICSTTTVQSNDAHITNNIGTDTSTGGVKANANTGGSVDVTTGDAETTVTVVNTANSNTTTPTI